MGANVSEEAVAALEMLKASLTENAAKAKTAVSALQACFDSCKASLGPHVAEQTRELLEVQQTVAETEKNIARLTRRLGSAISARKNILGITVGGAAAAGTAAAAAGAAGGGKSGGKSGEELPDGPLSGTIVKLYGDKYRTDDNETPYAVRNPETGKYEMLPNADYTLNGYRYRTDANGNISDVSGKLRVKSGKRPGISDTPKGMTAGDERGHLIADVFGGSNKIGNLVAMGFDLNRVSYRALEKKLYDAANAGRDVSICIEVKYDGSGRPTKLVLVYSIDGEVGYEQFTNDARK